MAGINRRRSKISGESTDRQPAEGLFGRPDRALFPRPADFAWRAGILYRGDLSEFCLQPAQLWLFPGSAKADLLPDLWNPRLQPAKPPNQQCETRPSPLIRKGP